MWRYSALRRSITTRCPTSAIRYDDTYDPIPFSRYTPTIAHAMRKTSCCLGSTLSKIGLMRYARPADPTAYTTMPAIAHARRPRYGVAYSNRRCRVVTCLGMASGTPNLKERRKITSPPQGTQRTGGSKPVESKIFASVPRVLRGGELNSAMRLKERFTCLHCYLSP